MVFALLRDDAAVAGGVLAAAGWLAGASVPEAVALFLLLCVVAEVCAGVDEGCDVSAAAVVVSPVAFLLLCVLVEVCVADEVDCVVSAAAVLVSLVAFLLLFFFVDFAAVSVAVD